MSDWDPQNPRDARAQARTEAAMAKAKAKAMRPWYRKKRFILPLVGVALIIIIAVAAGSGSKKSNNTTGNNTTGVSTLSNNGSHAPQADVTIQSCEVDVIKVADAKGVIVNHSSKSSNYQVHIGFMQGATRVAEGYALTNSVQPGQTANFDAPGSPQVTNGQPVACQLISVDRQAASG